MRKIRLIKFRPLTNSTDFERAKGIIENKKFYCAKLWDLNDPMEGVYKTTNESIIGKVFTDKNRYVICSFSSKDELENSLLWGYYTHGYKGFAVEIEYNKKIINDIDNEKIDDCCIVKVDYVDNILEINDSSSVPKIISTKLKNWKHEDEYRYLNNTGSGNLFNIGKIKTVYFGDPYGSIYNKREIVSESKTMKCYNEYLKYLWQCCKNNRIEPVLFDGYQKKKELPDLPNEPRLSDDCKPVLDQSPNRI